MYVPETVVTTRELMAQMQNSQDIDLEGVTGIKSRRRR